MTIRQLSPEAHEAVLTQGTNSDMLCSLMILAHVDKARSEVGFLQQCLKTIEDIMDIDGLSPAGRLKTAEHQDRQRTLMGLKLVDHDLRKLLAARAAVQRSDRV